MNLRSFTKYYTNFIIIVYDLRGEYNKIYYAYTGLSSGADTRGRAKSLS